MERRTALACFICVFCSSGIESSSSEQRFIQTNNNLHLNVTPELQLGTDLLFWKFNNSQNIVILTPEKIIILPNYQNRVEQNLSLMLKNVQVRDSGIYTAVVSGDSDRTVAMFDVRVEDPVSEVSLSLDSVSHTSHSCNFTVSCTTDHSSISRSFTCDTRSCEEPRPPPSGHASPLHLYLSNVSIICNHSNHVSWTQVSKDMQQVCSEDKSGGGKRTAVIVAVVVVALLVLSTAVCVLLRRRQTRRRMVMEDDTFYAEISPVQRAPDRPIPLEESPSTTYSLVGQHGAPAPAPVQNIESLYATVHKPRRTKS